MEIFPRGPFETVKTRIVRGDECPGGGEEGFSWWRPWNSCFWMRGTG